MSRIFLLTIRLPNRKYYQAEVCDEDGVCESQFEDLEWKEVKPVEVTTTMYIEV